MLCIDKGNLPCAANNKSFNTNNKNKPAYETVIIFMRGFPEKNKIGFTYGYHGKDSLPALSLSDNIIARRCNEPNRCRTVC